MFGLYTSKKNIVSTIKKNLSVKAFSFPLPKNVNSIALVAWSSKFHIHFADALLSKQSVARKKVVLLAASSARYDNEGTEENVGHQKVQAGC
jgi:hypothetical protein